MTAANNEAWHMTLADGTKTQDGVTLSFTDVDKDGKVSRGDTLTINAVDANGDPVAPPALLLKDTKTGLYVTPGFELALLVAGLGAVALTLRRRG